MVDGIVYSGGRDGNVYALDATDGTERWRFTTGNEVDSSPAVVDQVVYFGSDDGNVYALDALKGTERWRFSIGPGVYSSPAVIDGGVYIGSNDGNVYALDAVTGAEKWRFLTGGAINSSPAVVDHIVYTGSNDGNMYALDAETGTERWRYTTGDFVVPSPAVVGGVVYFGSRDGNVYAIGARPLILEAGGRAVAVGNGAVLRGAPAVSGVERATLAKGTAVALTGEAVVTGNLVWWPVVIDDTGELGWITAADLEPTANAPSATPTPNEPSATPSIPGRAGPPIVLEAMDPYEWDKETLEAAPGQVIQITNVGLAQHNFVVDEWAVEQNLPNGQPIEVTVPDDVTAGDTFVYYCSIPGHREGGMEGELTIVESGASTMVAAASTERQAR